MKPIRLPRPENRATGRAYVPYLKTHQCRGAHGVKSRLVGITTGRIHHLLSRNELRLFYVLDWAGGFADIREQFALDIPETISIANDIGVKHPRIPVTQELSVMTSDFVVTKATGEEIAFSVKEEDALNDLRTMEKQEIERAYWIKKGIPWKLVTPALIPSGLASNIEWFFNAASDRYENPLKNRAEDILLRHLERGLPLCHATKEVDTTLDLLPGAGFGFVRYFLATKRWKTDLSEKIEPTRPIWVEQTNNTGGYPASHGDFTEFSH